MGLPSLSFETKQSSSTRRCLTLSVCVLSIQITLAGRCRLTRCGPPLREERCTVGASGPGEYDIVVASLSSYVQRESFCTRKKSEGDSVVNSLLLDRGSQGWFGTLPVQLRTNSSSQATKRARIVTRYTGNASRCRSFVEQLPLFLHASSVVDVLYRAFKSGQPAMHEARLLISW